MAIEADISGIKKIGACALVGKVACKTPDQFRSSFEQTPHLLVEFSGLDQFVKALRSNTVWAAEIDFGIAEMPLYFTVAAWHRTIGRSLNSEKLGKLIPSDLLFRDQPSSFQTV